MILCPECSNECSAQATACPKCGHPFVVEQDTVIVTPTPPKPQPEVIVTAAPKKKNGFPAWAFVPIALAAVLLVFALLWMTQNNQEEANTNVNVRVRETAQANSRAVNTSSQQPTTVNPPSSADSTVVVPPSTQTNVPSSTTTTVPPSSTTSAPTSLPPSSSQTVVTEPTTATKGNLTVTTTLLTRTGSKQPIRKEKLYLLSKDLNEILSKAGIEPTEGDYASTLGAAVADPLRKDELNKMLAAIKPYIVASTITDGSGKAVFKDVKPDNYYLFGVTKTGNSASVWNTSVFLNTGENTIELNAVKPEEPSRKVADYEDDEE